MSYVRYRWSRILPCVAVFAAFNVYFFLFMERGVPEDMVYLDTLLAVPGILVTAADWWKFQKDQKERQRLLEQKDLICRMVPDFENKDLAEHDVQILEEQLSGRFQENCDLQDYVAKWCHELKLPLSAAFLMDEKIEDRELKMAVREQLEKINQQVNTMLSGCRLQNPLLDIQVKETALEECVRTSLHNNRFFLIQKGFEVTVEVEPNTVYTDQAWLVYVLDQLIANAVKYGKKEPMEPAGQERQEGKSAWREPTPKESAEGKPAERKSAEGKPAEGRADKGKPTDGKPAQEKAVQGENMGQESPVLRIWSQKQGDEIRLFVEDHGQGIRACDIRRIFEKGFTGRNYHNGKYKSTGMGLYLASMVLEKMGHEIYVESEYGIYTRFSIVFRQNTYFLP